MYSYLIVFVGAGIGGSLRHGTNLLTAKWFGTGFPFGTLTVNVFGSFAMGVLAGWFAFKGEASQPWRLFLATGVLGGFTTFSAFSLDALLLWERGEAMMAAFYVIGSVMLSLAALAGGMALMRGLS